MALALLFTLSIPQFLTVIEIIYNYIIVYNRIYLTRLWLGLNELLCIALGVWYTVSTMEVFTTIVFFNILLRNKINR